MPREAVPSGKKKPGSPVQHFSPWKCWNQAGTLVEEFFQLVYFLFLITFVTRAFWRTEIAVVRVTRKAFWGNLRILPFSFSPQSPSLLPAFSWFHFLSSAHISLPASPEQIPPKQPKHSSDPFQFCCSQTPWDSLCFFQGYLLNNHTFRLRSQGIPQGDSIDKSRINP